MLKPEPKYKFRVSTLSHVEFCVKRGKIESFNKLPPIRVIDGKGAIIIGNRLHFEYSYAYRDFDRVLVRNRLGLDKGESMEKQLDDILIRGRLDDLNIIRYKDKKFTSLVEVKTTNKKYLWRRELNTAIRQLELYLWLYRDRLEKIGFPLWKRHYVEIYSQRNGKLIKRVIVYYNERIEEWIRLVVKIFQGLHPMTVSPFSYCRLCPKQVKERCSWYELRKEEGQ